MQLIHRDSKLVMTRFISRKLYKVEFSDAILAITLIAYINMPDEMFIRLSRF